MPVTSHTPGVRELAEALARYGDALSAGTGFRPDRVVSARAYFGAVCRADGPANCWPWARVLAEWPTWRPHRLERRLLLPDESELVRVAGACRAARADRPGWRVSFGKVDAPEVRDVLGTAADLLEAVREPAASTRAALESLVVLGRDVDEALVRLPEHWPPLRLARLVTRLAAPAGECPYPLPGDPGGWAPVLAAAGVAVRESGDGVTWWRRWLGAEGGDWFHDLATAATESSAARQWLEAHCAALAVECFPRVHPEDGTVSWPDSVPAHPPGIHLDAGNARGWTVERFATTPEGARFAVPGGNAPLTAALAAWHELADPATSSARARLALALARALNSPSPTAEDVLAVLDAVSQSDGGSVPPSNPVPSGVRVWAEAGGWRILTGSAMSPDGRVTRPVFKRDVPAGAVVRVKALGLAGEGGVVRPAEVVVSAGPPPVGLAELEALVGTGPDEALDEFREALRGLRAAGAGGYLELAATDLHQLFWDRVLPRWADPKAAAAAGDALAGMLREAFGLLPLVPRHFRDHPPDWVSVPPGTRMVTGRVTRVLRPGLTNNGVLRLPAVVEAE